VTRWYHCVSRCVRKAFLLGEGDHNRRKWLENRLEELAEIFAVAVGGFAVVHNHLHVLLRLESRRNWPGSSSGWVLLPRAGATRWAISGASVCWAVSLRPAASNYGQSPNNLVCGTWST
jgi:REP element-mobilizing transposase RayT